MEMYSNNFFVKHAYYFKLVVSTFTFKPNLGIMFLKSQCFITKSTWLSATCLQGLFCGPEVFVSLKESILHE